MNVIIDDFIPTRIQSGKPAFATPRNKEIWVVLIEKAFAKLYGSYYAIQAGVEGESFRILTGAAVDYLYFDEFSLDKREDLAWKFIVNNLDNDFFLTSSSRLENKNLKQSQYGIVSNHSYAVLDAREINIGKDKKAKIKTDKLIKMRNPWGNLEWNGEWSDDSELWTSQIKKNLNYDPKFDDGTFWINLKNFLKHFGRLCCCKVRPNYLYKSIRVKQEFSNYFSMVNLIVKEKTHINLSVIQKAKRYFKAMKEAKYDYSISRIIVCKINEHPDEMEYILGKVYEKQSNSCEDNFEPGNYLIMIDFEWSQHYMNSFVVG